MPRQNMFLLDGNIGKPKTLAFYEEDRLNFYIRSRRKPDETITYYEEMNALRPNMHAGNLWSAIKKIFKKGKKIAKNTFDYIDQSPILNTIKDIGFEAIKNKTGIDPNDYYTTARNIANIDKEGAKNTVQKMLNKTKDQVKNYINDKKENKKFDYKNVLKNVYNEMVESVPQYKPQLKNNFDLFSAGAELSGSDNDVIIRNIPKLLLMSKSSRGTFTIKKDFKPLLLKYNLKTLTVPKTLKDFADKVIKSSAGRLYMGHGEDAKSSGNTIQPPKQNTTGGSKNKYNRYNEILEKLKH